MSKPPDFSHADFSGQDLSGQKLRKARMWQTNLSNANLDGADLTGAELLNADLTGASMIGTRLARSTIRDARMTEANLTFANLVAATIERSSLRGSNLSHAIARMSSLISVDIRYSSFAFANLSKSTLFGCRLDNSIFIETILKDTTFPGSHGKRAEWEAPDESETEQARLREARNCSECKEIWAEFSDDFCLAHSAAEWSSTTLLRAADAFRVEKLREYRSELRKCSSCLEMVLMSKNSTQCATCATGQARQDYETRRKNVNRGRGDPYRWWRQS